MNTYLIILENIVIFGLGVLLGFIVIIVISSYFMLKSVTSDRLKENILTVEFRNDIYYKRPKTLREAIYIWFTLFTHHMIKKTVDYRNDKLANRIFISLIPITVFIILLASIFSFTVHSTH